MCAPAEASAVFQLAAYGAVVTSAPRFAPSSLNCTPATPTLSDAVAETVIVPETAAPLLGLVSDTVGATLSTVTVTALDVVRFPAASRAIAVRVCEPAVALVVFHDTEYGAAATSVPRFAPSSWNCTPTTPTLSDAVAATTVDPTMIDPLAGDVIATNGAMVSAPPSVSNCDGTLTMNAS